MNGRGISKNIGKKEYYSMYRNSECFKNIKIKETNIILIDIFHVVSSIEI